MNTTLSVICFTETLKRYHQLNEVLPQIIVVYRDGVGDGQLEVFIIGRFLKRSGFIQKVNLQKK